MSMPWPRRRGQKTGVKQWDMLKRRVPLIDMNDQLIGARGANAVVRACVPASARLMRKRARPTGNAGEKGDG